jgi:hypothetical protein
MSIWHVRKGLGDNTLEGLLWGVRLEVENFAFHFTYLFNIIIVIIISGSSIFVVLGIEPR